MFGTYRTVLALMVVVQHLGGVPAIGAYAVFAFYMLSGYLMTLIMHESYGYDANGRLRYAMNRILRIFPHYWCALLLSLLLILVVGEFTTWQFFHALYVPNGVWDWLQNFFMVLFAGEPPRLVPPAWALTVEFVFYIGIGLGLSRTRWITWLWFGVALAYHLFVNFYGLPWEWRYFRIPAAALPFATGALAYHYRGRLPGYLPRAAKHDRFLVLLALLFLLNWGVGYWLDLQKDIFFYSSFFINAVVISTLASRTQLDIISADFDKWLGAFSYPIYLIHFQVGIMVTCGAAAVGLEVDRKGPVLVALALPVIFGVCWLMIRYVEHPIEIWRRRIKSRRQA